MKKILLSILCSAWTGIASSQFLGNLVSVVPDSAIQGQTLTTTITQPQGSWVMASPPCDNMGIYLERQGEIIYSTSFNPIWMDQCEVTFTIPQNATPGLYNVYYAGATWDPWFWTCSTIGYWEMLDGFEITGTTGIVGPASLTHAYVNYNQATSEIRLSPEFNSDQNQLLYLYDIYGKEISRLRLNGRQSIYLGKPLESGIYFLRIGNHTGKFAVSED